MTVNLPGQSISASVFAGKRHGVICRDFRATIFGDAHRQYNKRSPANGAVERHVLAGVSGRQRHHPSIIIGLTGAPPPPPPPPPPVRPRRRLNRCRTRRPSHPADLAAGKVSRLPGLSATGHADGSERPGQSNCRTHIFCGAGFWLPGDFPAVPGVPKRLKHLFEAWLVTEQHHRQWFQRDGHKLSPDFPMSTRNSLR